MNLEEMFRLFIDSRKRGVTGARRKCADETIRFYDRNLKSFQTFLEEEAGGISRYESIKRPHIVQLLDWLDEKEKSGEWSKATCLQMLRTLRAFFRWVDKDEDCQLYELRGLQKYLPVIQNTPQRKDIPEISVLKKFLAAYDTSDVWQHRDYVAASLFLSNGIRLGELCKLRMDGLKFEDKMIIVTGKTDTRLVPVTNDMVRILKVWLKRRSKLRFASSEYVFVSKLQNRISESSLAKRFASHYKACGLPRVTAHTFRHLFCTTYLRRDGNIEKLRCITGHSSYAILLNYLHEARMGGKEIQADLEKVNLLKD